MNPFKFLIDKAKEDIDKAVSAGKAELYALEKEIERKVEIMILTKGKEFLEKQIANIEAQK